MREKKLKTRRKMSWEHSSLWRQVWRLSDRSNRDEEQRTQGIQTLEGPLKWNRNPVGHCRRLFNSGHCELGAEIPMENFRGGTKISCEVQVSRVKAAGRMVCNLVTTLPSSLCPGVRPAKGYRERIRRPRRWTQGEGP